MKERCCATKTNHGIYNLPYLPYQIEAESVVSAVWPRAKSCAFRLTLHRAFVLNLDLLRLDCPCVWIAVRLDEYLINFGHRG